VFVAVFFVAPTSTLLRFDHCYTDEDLMGRVTTLCGSCHASTCENTALTKYGAFIEFGSANIFPEQQNLQA
jgi:hypothetical protein